MAAPAEAGPGRAGARFFCTAGRGLEPFVLREVRARLAATQVEYISGKVFFSTCCGLDMLKKLKSAERVFLLIRKQLPLARRRGKILRELQSLISDDPESWLGALSIWKDLLEADAEEEKLPRGHVNAPKRKAGRSEDTGAKRPRAEAWPAPAAGPDDDDGLAPAQVAGPQGQQRDPARPAGAPGGLTFRVSCRCSGAVGQACTAQEAGRVLGVALKKRFGWKADLRSPGVEIFVHLNDIYSVVGIPIFRAPLASRAYIQTAGLRSTVAWALASLADIQAGAFVLDPMCGLGTILLEAAKEWPDVYYVGADVSDKQLLGASDNLRAAGLEDKVELVRVSVTELPWPSESVDAVISDVPFGKKFRLGRDFRSVLQEMQRVLRVGGTLVLLLSEDLQGHLSGWNKGSTALSPGAGPADKHGPAVHSVPGAQMEPDTERTGVGAVSTEPPPGGVVCGEGVARTEPAPGGVACREGVARSEPAPGGVACRDGVARTEPPPGGVVCGEGVARTEPPPGGVVCGEGVARTEPPPGGVVCGEGVARTEPPPGGVVCGEGVARTEPPPGGVVCGEGVARTEPPPGGVVCGEGVARTEPPPGGVVCGEGVARTEPPPGGVVCGEGVARTEPPPGGVVCGEGVARTEPPPGGVVCGEGVARTEPPPGGVVCREGVARTEPPPGGVVCREGVARTEPPPGGVACGKDTALALPLVGSLILVEQFLVSLGKTEAFLCKYKKGPQLGPLPVSRGRGCLDSVGDPGPQMTPQA
ncbi:THUMP domain-containing protein 2 [Sorex fumeus]|uniref:THUMP domain-containing protein 2 n=1 Tax=Sorex fumeus TaxID=62283 RepID=UPI0024AE56E1|nr:THUMP domain-containing protein 2 [Sorex fumeus]